MPWQLWLVYHFLHTCSYSPPSYSELSTPGRHFKFIRVITCVEIYLLLLPWILLLHPYYLLSCTISFLTQHKLFLKSWALLQGLTYSSLTYCKTLKFTQLHFLLILKRLFLKCKYNQITRILLNLQWFLIAFRKKKKFQILIKHAKLFMSWPLFLSYSCLLPHEPYAPVITNLIQLLNCTIMIHTFMHCVSCFLCYGSSPFLLTNFLSLRYPGDQPGICSVLL